MELIVASFYKYVNLDNPEVFQKEHLDFCNSLGVKGKILVAKEGINGAISGTKEQIEKYQEKLNSYQEFSDIWLKKTKSSYHPYRKMIVRIRNEIVTSGFDVDIKNTGKHLEPSEVKKLYDNNEDFVMIDARNNYEMKIGKFKNAVTPNIKFFRDFKKLLPQFEVYKNKKVVLYCTAGVRCEKASAFLSENGFEDVNQINGGIVNFIEQYPDTYFEGRCFIFDDRLSIQTGNNVKDITVCERCHEPCGEYINCANMKCDKLFVCCKECKEKYLGLCSKKCKAFYHPKN